MDSSRPICPMCQARARLIYQRVFQRRDWWLARCGCGAHFTWPRPAADDISAFYDGDYHADLIERADTFQRYIGDFAAMFPAGRALDVGCSTGTMPALLRDAGYQAEGLELNPRTAAVAARTPGLTIHTGSFERFDEANGPYDLIVMTDLVEHTEDPIATMRKVNRLLKPGGGAYIRFPDIRSLKSRYYRILARLTGRDWMWLTCQIPQHTFEFTRPIAELCFSRAGFEIAAFNRDESLIDRCLTGKLAVLAGPMRPLSLGPLARRFGTQMAFVLRKV